MPLSVMVRLRTGRYDAATLDPRRGEWPPSPARLFSALVASSAGDAADEDVLRALENAGPPVIHASPLEDVRYDGRSGWVVTNRIKAGGSQTWPGRTNGLRERVSVIPGCELFAFVWPELELPDAQLGRLSRLAWRVPYVGRTTSHALVTVIPETVPVDDGQVVWRPVGLGLQAGLVSVDVPGPGYLEALETAFAAGESAARAPRRTVKYRCGDTQPDTDSTADGPFETDLIVRGFASGKVPLPGEEVLQVAQTFRAAVMERAQRFCNTLPRQVSGHGADDVAHLAYLALPSVGYDHADGHLLGVAVAVPSGIDVQERAVVVQAVSTMTELTSSRRWSFPLSPATRTLSQWGLNPRRWAPRDGVTDWVSATPVMLDHFPKKSGKNTAVHRVAESLVHAGYPQPCEVEVVPAPPLPGGIQRPGMAEALRNRDRRPMVHCRVRFPAPVHGPVLAGRLRYLGVGLFVPDLKGETGGIDR